MATTYTAKAIETRYRGHRYRSRLEARWAVFLDTAGIPFEYEREGFELRDGEGTLVRYLPDFWLPEQKCWVEIKGQEPSQQDMQKVWLLEEARHEPVFVFYGSITVPDHETMPPRGWRVQALEKRVDDGDESDYVYTGEFSLHSEYVDEPVYWSECFWCDRPSLAVDGSVRYVRCSCDHSVYEGDGGYSQLVFDYLSFDHDDLLKPRDTWIMAKMAAFERAYDSPRLINAYRAASYARFEYGEAGR